jgi:hypothetical protein
MILVKTRVRLQRVMSPGGAAEVMRYEKATHLPICEMLIREAVRGAVAVE